MKTAKVIWADGRETVETVVAETATTFTTGDVNATRWHKGKDGARVGSFGYIRKALRGRAYWTQATAKMEAIQ